jgi:hypothetical protein
VAGEGFDGWGDGAGLFGEVDREEDVTEAHTKD